MKKSSVIYVVVAALAVCAQARAVGWDQADPVSGSLESVMSAAKDMPAPAGQAAEPRAVSGGKDSIEGKAVVDNRVSLSLISPLNVKDFGFELLLNNTGDRVGANVSVCGVHEVTTGKGAHRVMTCQTVFYVFPGLRYDAAAKQVLSGDEVVARDRGFWHGGLKLEKGFKPEYKIVGRQIDRGFNRDTELSVEASIARASSR
jgi:hypothetical protein